MSSSTVSLSVSYSESSDISSIGSCSETENAHSNISHASLDVQAAFSGAEGQSALLHQTREKGVTPVLGNYSTQNSLGISGEGYPCSERSPRLAQRICGSNWLDSHFNYAVGSAGGTNQKVHVLLTFQC